MNKVISYPLMLFLMLYLNSCSKSDTTSECLDQEIAKFKTEATCENAKVDEYLFQTITVYVFDGQSCFADGGSTVIDENFTVLGSLGTILGNSKINGVDFSTATFVKNIWKK